MNIRKVTFTDMTKVMELIQEIAAVKKPKSFTISVYDLMRDGFLESPKFNMFVVEDKDDIIGFALFYKSFSLLGKSVFIKDVYVKKDYKKQGIGLSLFSKILDFSLNEKIKRITWLLLKEFSDLKKLYIRAGANIVIDQTIFSVYESDIKKIAEANINTKSDFFAIRFMEMKDAPSVISLLEKSEKLENKQNTIDVYDLMKYGLGNNPWFKMLIVEIKNEIIGYLMFTPAYCTFCGNSLDVESVFVDNEYQNMGIGKLLYYSLFDYANKHNYKKITQAINIKNKKFMNLVHFFGGTHNPELQIVEITDESLKHFIEKS